MGRRVLWVVKGLGPGGAERLLVEIAQAGAFEDGAIECAYVVPWKDHLADELAGLGVETHCLSRWRSDPRWPVALARLIRERGYAVVHVHAPLPGAVARLAVRAMPAERRPQVVTTEHNAWPTYHPMTRWLNRLTGRSDAATIAVSSETAASLRGRAAKRVEVLRHGVDVNAVATAAAERHAVRAEIGVADEIALVVTVANYRDQKDYPTLLRAARILADSAVRFRLLAIGQGPLERDIVALRDELGLGDVVEICGFRADARRLLAAADVFVLSSKYEGLPVAAMEATALGVAIVSTAVGGMAEEWTDGVDALLVPAERPDRLAQALEQVIEDRALRERLSKASLAKAARFDIGAVVDRMRGLYGIESARPAAAPRAVRRAGPADSLAIRRASGADRDEIIDVLWAAMGAAPDDRNRALFAWKHDENPFGASPIWVATDEERIVGVRAMMRWRFRRGVEVLSAARAVDTATLPAYQGRGLFRRLTEHALDELAGATHFVFNTPNQQSLPGYLTMGWGEVGKLAAAMSPLGRSGPARAVRSRVAAELWSEPVELGEPASVWLARNDVTNRTVLEGDVRRIVTDTSQEFWSWRLGLGSLHYRVIDDGDVAVAVRVRRRGNARELVVVGGFGARERTDALARQAARRAGCDYALRLGGPNLRHGFVALPTGGPLLTWRSVDLKAMPPLANWSLTMGDVELF